MKILVVEDDPLMQATLKTLFKDSEVSLAGTFQEANRLLEKTVFAAAFLDINLESQSSGTGLDLLQKIRERDNYLPCVMISGIADKKVIMKCLDHGAVDYVIKGDHDPDVYLLALHKALMWKKIFSESSQTRRPEKLSGLAQSALLGDSPAMVQLRENIARVGFLDGPYLVLGETGTGKELVARELWAAKGKVNRPFIAVNCASLPENLVESELFGYERGAFTGALTTKTGLFEAANGGDIFLDEIGEFSIELQAKLLRVLQEKKVRRLGSDRERPVDFRVIAATNVDLASAIEAKEFREDLFYRLNVHQIRIPNLEARKDVIPLLKSFFEVQGINKIEFDDDAKKLLEEFPWPGNVRQVKAFSQYLIPYLDSKNRVTAERVQHWIEFNSIRSKSTARSLSNAVEPEEEIRRGPVDIIAKLDKLQKSYVHAALRLSNDNRSQAAKILGVSRQRLSNWLGEWDQG